MKRMRCIMLGFLLMIFTRMSADEGMWLLPLIQKLNIDTMHSLGLKLNADDIYSINHGSLKDAIVMFDGGCTGEIISNEGLLITNHHCGYDAIQNHSTLEHNYLEDGFWAKNHSEELPNPDMTVNFLIRVEDVTQVILSAIQDTLSENERNQRISEISDSITRAATGGTTYDAVVESYFGGNDFYLCVYETFNDVRLVGAPPSSIGKFGHDTDNWMWPRHTGDFSIFRVYSDPEGKPAEYSSSNIPLTPENYLSISLKGVNNSNYTMVIGYPGHTNRYMTSYEVNELLNITNPNRIKIRGLRQSILLKDMMADENVNIKYSSKYSISSNYWKYSIGQNQGLVRLNIIKQKEQQESEFTTWINADDLRKQKYGAALSLIKKTVERRAKYEHTLEYIYECFFTSTEIIAFANKATYLYITLLREPENKRLIDSLAGNLMQNWEAFNKEYHVPTDRKVLPAILKLYHDNVQEEYYPGVFSVIRNKYKNNYDDYANDLFRKSIFADRQKMVAFVNKPTFRILDRDPAFQAALSALDIYRQVYLRLAMFDDDYEKGHRLYVAGLMDMNHGKILYPDANSTMRLSYGTVCDYYPRDAVHYDYYTTLEGIMEKEDPDNWEFIVPARLKELYKNKDYGQYGNNGKMPTCFITNNDITGGNSGSPVMDGDGNLLGLAFDGNWEAMSGDIIFEPALQRCICVDIRYVLFIIDKYAGATNLLTEMKIIK
jgi:hypothetical protein